MSLAGKHSKLCLLSYKRGRYISAASCSDKDIIVIVGLLVHYIIVGLGLGFAETGLNLALALVYALYFVALV